MQLFGFRQEIYHPLKLNLAHEVYSMTTLDIAFRSLSHVLCPGTRVLLESVYRVRLKRTKHLKCDYAVTNEHSGMKFYVLVQ